MKPLLIEIDDRMAEALERVAPARGRKRSDFVRMAIRRALWDLEERRTRRAYEALPDRELDAWLDPSSWEPSARSRRRRAR